VNLALKVLRAILNDARRKGVVTTNVAEAVETLPEEATNASLSPTNKYGRC
jgi:hypothetical protein